VANKTPKFLNQQNAGMHAMQAVSIKKISDWNLLGS